MARQKKGTLEKIGDMILLDDAIKEGYVGNTGNKHGFGRYMREHGIINPAWEADINKHEKTGFSEEQLEDLDEFGTDADTKRRYNE